MQRFKNIVFVPRLEPCKQSLVRAVELAQHNNAKLTILEIVDKPVTWLGTASRQDGNIKAYETLKSDRSDLLKNTAKSIKEQIQIETIPSDGKNFMVIIREVLRNGYDLVIKNTADNPIVNSRLFASDDMQLLRKCPCPVLLTKHDCDGPFKNILAAVDFEDPNDLESENENNSLNRQILEMSISLANREHSHLDVLHVFDVDGDPDAYTELSGVLLEQAVTQIEEMRREMHRVVDRLMVKTKEWVDEDVLGAVDVRTHSVKGHAKTSIAEQSRTLKSDLVVMGTVGRVGIPGFVMGNTAETVLNDIDCSVLALKPDGFESPVKL